MKRLGPVAFVSLCALAAACVDNENVVMSIQGNQAAQKTNMCTVDNSDNGAQRDEGLLDVAVVEGGYDGFMLFPLVRNQLIERAGIGTRDSIALMGADIQLVPDGSVSGALPSAARTFFAPGAGGTVNPGKLGVMSLHAIPRAQALLLAAAVKDKVVNPPVVTVRYRAVGTRAGDVINSGWVEFPVRLCRNCLSGGPFGACPANGFDAAAVAASGCFPQQDDGNLCCNANNGTLFCPGGVKISQ